MRGDYVPWVRLDDAFPENVKIVQAGPVARDLFVAALCYANRNLTDGFVPDVVIPKLCQNDDHDVKRGVTAGLLRARLVDLGLWEDGENNKQQGIWIHDFLKYQPSRQKVESSREQSRNRMRTSREQAAKFGGSSAVPDPDPYPRSNTEPVTAFVNEVEKGSTGGMYQRYAARLSDADANTAKVIEHFAKDMPEAAVARAWEALETRRKQKPKLVSEAKYFVASLKSMLAEGQYVA